MNDLFVSEFKRGLLLTKNRVYCPLHNDAHFELNKYFS